MTSKKKPIKKRLKIVGVDHQETDFETVKKYLEMEKPKKIGLEITPKMLEIFDTLHSNGLLQSSYIAFPSNMEPRVMKYCFENGIEIVPLNTDALSRKLDAIHIGAGPLLDKFWKKGSKSLTKEEMEIVKRFYELVGGTQDKVFMRKIRENKLNFCVMGGNHAISLGELMGAEVLRLPHSGPLDEQVRKFVSNAHKRKPKGIAETIKDLRKKGWIRRK